MSRSRIRNQPPTPDVAAALDIIGRASGVRTPRTPRTPVHDVHAVPTVPASIRNDAGELRAWINRFLSACARNEHTDTDEVHVILRQTRAFLRRVIETEVQL